MIYGSVKSTGIDPKGMEDIPSKYLTSGRGWQSSSIVVHLGENILTYLKQFSPNQWILAKTLLIFNSCSQFLTKILAHNFNQNYSQNAKFGSVRPIELVFYSSSPAVNLFPKVLIKLHNSSFKNTKFSSF